MLEKPELDDYLIISRLQEAYGLEVSRLAFLPLGVDVNAAVFRIVIEDGTACFLKLRKGDFAEITVALPSFLRASGLQAVIAPLATRDGKLWASLDDDFKMVLYPFIEGKDGYEVAPTGGQWLDFGKALKGIHTAQLPPALMDLVPRETFSPLWREMVKDFLVEVEEPSFADPTAAALAMFMKARRDEIGRLVRRADELAAALQGRSLDLVLCHADMHAGNLLLGSNGTLYIVDWDNPLLSLKERDLALVGGCAVWSNERETCLFYRGYGPAEVDPQALAYYRYERIIQDIAEFSKQLLWTTEGGKDREQGLKYLMGSFLPGHNVEMAFEADTTNLNPF